MVELKPAKTIDELLEILQERGLQIENEEIVKYSLQNYTYYRLLYYFKKFTYDGANFSGKCSFSDILTYYNFDKWLRVFLFSLLSPIEVSVRSNLAQFLADKYKSDCFYNSQVFNYDCKNYEDILRYFETIIKERIEDPIVKHHNEKYDGRFPIFVVVQFLTFTNVSKLFSSLNKGDIKELSNKMFSDNSVYKKLDMTYVRSWLWCLSVLRNFCAHHVPLYERVYRPAPKISNLFSYDSSKNDSLFPLLLVMKRISVPEFWDEAIHSFRNYIEKKDYVDLTKYGFPPEWERYLINRNL